ncbi:hypothetical protein [Pseudoclavibacter terrae]|uniref:Toxin-antitoxin system n=1 Tax=Pseudoclavibacter terrae TaxID=1530195 RepID=A0A7J5AX98_9MICO|nr:hypothetical protein [Pseudoclavibacter terrae]KAB1636068.1 hypothetical protein F8O03_17570 [Pseudoclavibacter terrae]
MILGMGRPSKGERDAIMAKPAMPLAKVIRANAEASGYTNGDYITKLVAEALGMPEYAPKPDKADHGATQLPLETEAHSAAA